MSAELPRRTKIVATLGPVSSSRESVLELARAGMDVARLNFSHGTHEDHARSAALVREVAEEVGRSIAVIADLQGPKVRIGELAGAGHARPRRGGRRRGRGGCERRRASRQPDSGRRSAPARARHPDRRRPDPAQGRVGRARESPLHGRHRRCRRGAQGRERPRSPRADPVAHAEGHGRSRLRARAWASTTWRSRSCARRRTCAT